MRENRRRTTDSPGLGARTTAPAACRTHDTAIANPPCMPTHPGTIHEPLPSAQSGPLAPRSTATPAADVVTTALSWATPPRLDRAAYEHTYAQLVETRLSFDASTRQALGAWFLHMIEFGFTSLAKVAHAMDQAQPFYALHQLLRDTCHRLADHLNRLAQQHAHGYGDDFRSGLQVSMGMDADQREPCILLKLSGYYCFEVDTLHRLPPALAALAYESLELISRCLMTCLTPHDMWDGDFGGSNEDLREEYDALCAAGGTDDLPALAKIVQQRGLCYFSSDESALADEMEAAREMFEGRPEWMREATRRRPIARVRQLQAAMKAYVDSHGSHPWSTYAEEVCATLLSCFVSDRALTLHQRRVAATCLDQHDLEVPICVGLWINSGCACERRSTHGRYQIMAETGEEWVDRYALDAVASAHLRQILDHTAIGIGLLLRAEGVNTDVRRTLP